MAKILRFLLVGVVALVVALVGFVALSEALQARREAADVAAPAASKAVDIGDGVITVQEFGRPGQPAVVIVPGTAAWSGFWASAAQRIADAGFFVVAVDLPPFGFSSRPESGGYSRTEQAARLAALLDRLALDRPIVLAHSFGAGAAVELAMRRPGRLAGLMLVDGALALPPDGAQPPQDSVWLSAVLHNPMLARAMTDAVLINPWLTRRLLAALLARPEAATDAVVATLQTPYRRAGTSAAYARWLPALLLHDGAALSGVAAAYRGLHLPVALIWGGADRVTPIAQAERLSALIPGATLDTLPGLGHIPSIEDEGAFVTAAVARLREMASRH